MKQNKSFYRYQPGHLRKSRVSKGKVTALSVVMCIVAILSAVTLAYLIDTDEVRNTFTPAQVACEVNETFANNVKQNVTVKNTGTTSAYIRAIVVANWVGDTGTENAGKVYYVAPVAGEDYSIDYGSDWALSNGYYYYGSAVDVGESTGVLITSCTVLKAAPVEGYHLEVEIVAEAIQSEGTDSSGQTPASRYWKYDPGATGN